MTQQSHDWTYIQQKLSFERYMHPGVHRNAIYDSQGMEATRGMDREDVRIYNRLLLSGKRNTAGHLQSWRWAESDTTEGT